MSTYKKSVKNKKTAKKIIQRRMLYAAGLGFIPIPIIDAVGLMSNQVLMTKELADLYDVPFNDEHQIKALISSMVGTLGTIGVVKAIPVVGSISGGLAVSITGTASTYAIGQVFVQHFNMGGTLLDFDPVKSRQYFHESYEEGKRKAEKLRKKKANKLNKFINGISASKEENGVSHVSDEVLSAREAIVRKKVMRLKRHRAVERARRKRAWKRRGIFFLSIIGIFLIGYVIQNIRTMNEVDGDTTEIDLYMAEVQARKIALKPAQDLDSLTVATIAAFSPISTEGVIAKYIQDAEATYPKRYSLSSVRFIGSSEKLSSGANQQLGNIAFLMKKYPDLTVNLYGHTTNVGPKFNRQRIGRERARVLTEVFAQQGIPSYRITGNYIEKQSGTHQEYWGAEIVIDVSTIEKSVAVQEPTIPEKMRKKEAIPIPEPPKEEPIPDTAELVDSVKVEDLIDASELQQINLDLINSDTSAYTQARILAYLRNPNSVYPKIYLLSHTQFTRESVEVSNLGKEQIAEVSQIMRQFSTMRLEIIIHSPRVPASFPSNAERLAFVSKWNTINTARTQAIMQLFNQNGINNNRLISRIIQINKNPSAINWNVEIQILSL